MCRTQEHMLQAFQNVQVVQSCCKELAGADTLRACRARLISIGAFVQEWMRNVDGKIVTLLDQHACLKGESES